MELFDQALERFFETGRASLHIERDDGFMDTEDLSWYLTSYRSFPRYEKQALKFARGRVLDLGCGAGRHSLYLLGRGLDVTSVDSSVRLVELARRRGVKDVRLANACRPLPFPDSRFDTVLLFGNNLGMCGTLAKFRRMLRELDRVTTADGRILATTRMPITTEATHRTYVERNIEQGWPPGQIRLRLVLGGKPGAWFDLLLFAPTDLMQIVIKEGWRVREVFTDGDFEDAYAVVMEKNR